VLPFLVKRNKQTLSWLHFNLPHPILISKYMNFKFIWLTLSCCGLCCTMTASAQAGKHHDRKTARHYKLNGVPEINKDPVRANMGKFNDNFVLRDNKTYKNIMIVNPGALEKLDDLMERSVKKGVFPGCQVFASKNGEVIYKKNFGNYTYTDEKPVTDTTLYDIASVSKIMATTLAIMKLEEENKINLTAYLKNYIPGLDSTGKGDLIIQDLLMHQAGLKAWIPFYKKTIDSLTGKPRTDLFRPHAEKGFTIPVAAHFYLKNAYLDTVWQEILDSPLENLGHYVYSDLDFYFLQKVVENVSGKKLDKYVTRKFYKPLGLKHTLYNPWKKGLVQQCAPTEEDDYFRFQLIQGYVHDQGAAMMGGVAGHAGVFSTTGDLAVILQMLLNGGVYKNHRYFNTETVSLFTDYHSDLSRRGYGFDKPVKDKQGGPTSNLCSPSTFGHQGFTGTCAWADPETGIIFIFLSNRVYPTATNELIVSDNVRTEAQSYIYEALGYGKN
jgi:CubicO group peptidase (beta-lactamase class C family)